MQTVQKLFKKWNCEARSSLYFDSMKITVQKE